jgi:hypothetical protein
MISTGFPNDSDPQKYQPTWECSECQGLVVKTGKNESECIDCGTTFEQEPDR